MATISRRSLVEPIAIVQQLVAANDLDGTAATRRSVDVSGATRVILSQNVIATDGTAGIDVVLVSKDGGTTWAIDTTVLPVAQNDVTGTVVTSGQLNAAGAEPASAVLGLFKSGPYEGPTLLRICRKTGAQAAGAITWVTGSPAVNAIVIGGTTGAAVTVTHTSD